MATADEHGALNYSSYDDLTTEYLVRDEFADYGPRIDRQLVAFVECKRTTARSSAGHHAGIHAAPRFAGYAGARNPAIRGEMRGIRR